VLAIASLVIYQMPARTESPPMPAEVDSSSGQSAQADNPRRYGPVRISQNLSDDGKQPSGQLGAARPDKCHPASVPLRDLPAGGIYKRTDENGIIHYRNYSASDLPAGQTLVVEFPAVKDYFDLDIRVVEGSIDEQFRRALQRNGTTIFDYYKSLIDPGWLQRAKVRLVVYRTERAYLLQRDHYMSRKAGEHVPGFYVPHLNQAMIWHQGDDNAALRIASHEMTHVINRQLFGEMPRWLNEGLAILFEQSLAKENKALPPSPQMQDRRQIMVSHLLNRVSLAELVSPQPTEWTLEKRPLYYHLSESLLYFLLQPENRTFTRKLLNRLAAQKCQPFNVASHIEGQFPGGMAGLSERFNHWLKP